MLFLAEGTKYPLNTLKALCAMLYTSQKPKPQNHNYYRMDNSHNRQRDVEFRCSDFVAQGEQQNIHGDRSAYRGEGEQGSLAHSSLAGGGVDFIYRKHNRRQPKKENGHE